MPSPTFRPRVLCAAMTLLACAQAPAMAAAETTPPSKPNIICILADDVGLGDVHCTGGPFKTPRLDALAAGGTRFENCYAMPLCGPTRCCLLTGRYPFRTGLVSNQSEAVLASHQEVMLPTILKPAGYATACVGKWGQMPFGPGEWGFADYLSSHGSGRYRPEQKIEYSLDGTWTPLRAGEYLPDLMHQRLVRFLETNQDKPFFLYYPMEHIHGPILTTPDSAKDASPDRLYADNVEYMDKLVGRLVDDLDRLHLREKTLLVFIGDNGTAKFGVQAATVDGKAISGMKGSMLEGGSRVPMIVNWPGTTPAGKVCRDLVDVSDFYGTFAELAGATPPEGVEIDSHSLVPQIRGQVGTPREWIYVELGGHAYVREAGYKLTNAGALFDMRNAPFEEIPVPADSTDAAAVAARARLQAVLAEHVAGDAGGIKPKRRKAGRRAAQAP